MTAGMKEDKFSAVNCLNELYGLRFRSLLALTALFLFGLFSVLFRIIDPMFRAATDPGLIDLQLTSDAYCFQEIIVNWNKSVDGGVEIYKLSIVSLDYIFPIIYAVMLAFAYAAVRGNLIPRRFDRVMFILPCLGAFFDYSENTFHLLLLRDVHNLDQALAAHYSQLMVASSFTCSFLKFFFFCASILAFTGAAIYRLKNYRRVSEQS
jgi:hypothetical protein